jgi:crossover junction endodeoxyribonuclease RusA
MDPLSAISFEVKGFPRTQGSKRPMHRFHKDGKCKVWVIEETNPLLQEWRLLVSNAARRCMGNRLPLTGPVAVALGFRFPRPRMQTAAEHASPFVYVPRRYDIDKLERAILDALTFAGVWRDDSQVVALAAEKRWADGQAVGVRVVVEPIVLPVRHGSVTL